MQVEGRTVDLWCTLRFEASFAKVSAFLILTLSIINSIIVAHWNSLWRLSEVWHVKRPFLVEAVKSLLDEQNLGVKMALSEVNQNGLLYTFFLTTLACWTTFCCLPYLRFAHFMLVNCDHGLTLLLGWHIWRVVRRIPCTQLCFNKPKSEQYWE